MVTMAYDQHGHLVTVQIGDSREVLTVHDSVHLQYLRRTTIKYTYMYLPAPLVGATRLSGGFCFQVSLQSVSYWLLV